MLIAQIPFSPLGRHAVELERVAPPVRLHRALSRHTDGERIRKR